MAILRSHGILLVDSIPTHTPTAGQARLARLENTSTFYYYDGSGWATQESKVYTTNRETIAVDKTLVNADVNLQHIENSTGANLNVIFPVAPNLDKHFIVKNNPTSTGTITVNSFILNPGDIYEAVHDGTEWIVI